MMTVKIISRLKFERVGFIYLPRNWKIEGKLRVGVIYRRGQANLESFSTVGL